MGIKMTIAHVPFHDLDDHVQLRIQGEYHKCIVIDFVYQGHGSGATSGDDDYVGWAYYVHPCPSGENKPWTEDSLKKILTPATQTFRQMLSICQSDEPWGEDCDEGEQ